MQFVLKLFTNIFSSKYLHVLSCKFHVWGLSTWNVLNETPIHLHTSGLSTFQGSVNCYLYLYHKMLKTIVEFWTRWAICIKHPLPKELPPPLAHDHNISYSHFVFIWYCFIGSTKVRLFFPLCPVPSPPFMSHTNNNKNDPVFRKLIQKIF